jgi:hypothetical protein
MIVKRLLLPTAAFLAVVFNAHSQTVNADLNEYYRFPISIEVEYQSLTPFAAYNTPYTIFDVSGQVTIPLPMLPVLQPFLRGGMMRFDSIDPVDPAKWDHYHLYGSLGIAYTNRIVKNFEVGGEVNAGVSEAIFPTAVDTGSVGSPNLLFGAGAKVSLVPSYGFSIDFRPSVKYLLSLSPLNIFNGFLFSFGISASYRFGEDPDSARAVIRSLRLENIDIPQAFGAMQSYYAKNPLGQLTLVNTERQAVTDIEVSFFQAGYMDSPTASASLAKIPAGGSVSVPVIAVFNKQVFSTEGITPLTGEIIVSYKLSGRPAEQRHPVTYDLYDKTAIVWDHDEKAGAFITPQDSALKNYTAFVSEVTKKETYGSYCQQIQSAIQIYSGLRELGMNYQVDAASPFAKVQGQSQVVDSVTLPRLTLKRRYGDCDDLTVLFCSLLESKNVETGYVTMPGHIYPVFNTGVSASAYKDVNPDKSMTIVVDGTLWIPVEVTMLDGNNGFMEAWTQGIELWKANEKDRNFYRTRDVQKTYGPVSLQEADLGLQYGNKDSIVKFFSKDRDRLSDAVIKVYAADAVSGKGKKEYNKLGMIYAQFERYKDAEDAFGKALKVDPKFASAMVNLGNVAYLRGDLQKAVDTYKSAIAILGKKEAGAKLSMASMIALLNLSKTYKAMGKTQQAKDYLAQAAEIDPEKAKEYAYLATADQGNVKASGAGGSDDDMLFIEEE